MEIDGSRNQLPVEIDLIFTSGFLNKTVSGNALSTSGVLYLAISGSFHVFFKFSNKTKFYIYLHTNIDTHTHTHIYIY
jgi:hypothetical protein